VNTVFNHRLIEQIIRGTISEKGRAPKWMLLAARLFSNKVFIAGLAIIESTIGWLLNLPVPVYSSIVYVWVTNSRGLPYMSGMYLRSLYYKRMLGYMAPNVFIDHGVFFAHPKKVQLEEFAYIDKNVTFMAESVKVGRRVHIAPNVFVSGGGEFEIEDYACVAAKTSIITSTEVLKGGARCSGPMVSPEQRNVLRGKVLVKKDAFVGASATILPNVVVEVGSVVAAGITLARSTEPWGIYAIPKPQKVSTREPVAYPDN
jgi:carbonic anhydrase/acetyltransferase-like protein (isoleucine patch superfamily)